MTFTKRMKAGRLLKLTLKTAGLMTALSTGAFALAWLLRHPAGIQPIIGTTQLERVVSSCMTDSMRLSREEWTALYIAGRGQSLS